MSDVELWLGRGSSHGKLVVTIAEHRVAGLRHGGIISRVESWPVPVNRIIEALKNTPEMVELLRAQRERETALSLLRRIEDAGECSNQTWHDISEFLNSGDSKCCGYPTQGGRCTKCKEMDRV